MLLFDIAGEVTASCFLVNSETYPLIELCYSWNITEACKPPYAEAENETSAL